MFDLTQEITHSDEVELEKLLKAVLQRYAVLFPDYEVMTISLEKCSDPNQQLDRMIAMLQQMKTLPYERRESFPWVH